LRQNDGQLSTLAIGGSDWLEPGRGLAPLAVDEAVPSASLRRRQFDLVWMIAHREPHATMRPCTVRLLRRASRLCPCVSITGQPEPMPWAGFVTSRCVGSIGGKLVVNGVVPEAPHKGLAARHPGLSKRRCSGSSRPPPGRSRSHADGPGPAQELEDAVIINPYDIDAFAAALASAMNMGGQEQTARMRAMRKVVAGRNVFNWASDILEGLESLWTKPLLYSVRGWEETSV
jgi:Glycosyltransferase family 20